MGQQNENFITRSTNDVVTQDVKKMSRFKFSMFIVDDFKVIQVTFFKLNFSIVVHC